jgi:hypothetical protein
MLQNRPLAHEKALRMSSDETRSPMMGIEPAIQLGKSI